MKIFAIIVTYNAMHRGWIDRCMKSLYESTVPVVPVIVDNGSTDETRAHVPVTYPDAIWMPQEENKGFGQANNIGIKYALAHQADYVLLLNQDAAISPDAIERMLAVSDGQSLLSPLHLNGDGTKIDELFRETLKNAHNYMNDDLLIRHTLNDVYETGEICAACWFLPVSILQRIGGFNPLFFHYSEDNNYYHRLVFHHIKTLLVPHAYMYHDRLIQGNKKAYDHHRIRRELILAACNINKGLASRVVDYFRTLVRCYVHELPAHNYVPSNFLLGMGWILFHLGPVYQSRRQEKKKGCTWL